MNEPLQLLHVSAPEVRSSAVLSPCGRYRYRLEREWDVALPKAGWVLCNPSTADATADDPTIRKCVGFARRWGCGGIVVLNVCALRSTNPGALLEADDPVGPDNIDAFDRFSFDWHHWKANGYDGVDRIVLGWGNALPRRLGECAETALGWISAPTMCLGRTKAGAPRHPLMLAYSTPLEPFEET